METLEEFRQYYFKQAKDILDKYDNLKIIYIRVSTKDHGEEEDQLPQILKLFEIEQDECLIVSARESAYQLDKQKNRKLEIVKEIIEHFQDEEKILYVWDLDRLYRNQELQINLIMNCYEQNCIVLSYRQPWLYKLRDLGGFGKAVYHFLVELLAYLAEEESKKKAERLMKSLNQKKGKYYTNKGNLYGKKIRTTKGENITSITRIKNIENFIIKNIDKGLTYRDIQNKLEFKGIKISIGYISNLKQETYKKIK